MAKELLVNVSRGEEVRVALVEDGRLEELYLERDSAASNVGNVYLGKVTNVEGSIQAAFVDFGYGRNGFLHVQDLHPDYFPEGGKWDRMSERVGKKIGRRDRPPIQDCLRRGDHIVVQIIKEGIGTKGPTLTSYPSIPGRMLVAMPGVGQMGVSKNIEDEKERRRLRKILDTLEPPKDVGFIIRTAGMGKTKAEIERDFKYLVRVWSEIDKQRKRSRPPALLYAEGDLVTRTVRDVWNSDVDRVIVDDVETALRIKQFFKLLMPRTKVDVQLYEGTIPLFHATGVEREIETMFSRHVPIANGGSLVIDTTEAVVAIDVNTGKFREHGDAEETAFRMDLEAADEICRQLRLRDLGGVVICDFIDLRYARHRQALFDRLTENFKRDRAKSRHLEMSEFGIIEITRQRMRPDLKKAVYMPCPWSNGTGFIKTPESMALDVMRRLRVAVSDERVQRAVVRLYPSAALHVLNAKRQALVDLERQSNKKVELVPDDTLAADGLVFQLFDDRDGNVEIHGLQPREEEKVDQGHTRRRRRGGRGRNKGDSQRVDSDDLGAIDDDGLLDLDDLLPLGELKLEEVEDLAQQAAADRAESEKDPLDSVLEALRAPREPSPEEADNTDESADDAEDREGGKRRRRRRRRRRGGDEEEHAESANGDASTLDAEEDEVEAEASSDADESDEAPRRGRRRGGRRRRGRRSEQDEAQAPQESAADVDEAADAADAAEPAEAHEADEAAEPEPAAEEAPARSRRRRNRGRRVRSRPVATESARPIVRDTAEVVDDAPVETADEEVETIEDEVTTDDDIATPEDDAPEPDMAQDEAIDEPLPDPEAEVEAEKEAEVSTPPARRRRNRGKVTRSRPIAVAPAPTRVADPEPAPDPEPEPEPTPKKAAKKSAKKAPKRAKRAKKAASTDAEAAAPKKKATRRRKSTKKAASADE